MNPPRFFNAFARSVLSYLPYTTIIPKAQALRPQGISAVIRVKNSEDWIEACITSIKDFADEIVVADNNSTDATTAIVKRLSQSIPAIKYFKITTTNHTALSNESETHATYRWVIRWDSDFIAHTQGKNDIMNLRRLLLSLDPNRYYCLYLCPIHLLGDLEHVYSKRAYLWIDCLYTYSPAARYIFQGKNEALQLPKYYKIIAVPEHYFFHVNIKPRRAMLIRHFFDDWQININRKAYPSLEDYVAFRIQKDWHCGSLEEGEQYFFQHIIARLIVPYSQEIYGPYPALLEELRKKPKYRIIYKNGAPFDRIDTLP